MISNSLGSLKWRRVKIIEFTENDVNKGVFAYFDNFSPLVLVYTNEREGASYALVIIIKKCWTRRNFFQFNVSKLFNFYYLWILSARVSEFAYNPHRYVIP